MKSYKILELEVGLHQYKLDERTGYYTHHDGTQFGLLDFIHRNAIFITKVLCNKNNITYTKGDKYKQGEINYFTFFKNTLRIHLTHGAIYYIEDLEPLDKIKPKQPVVKKANVYDEIEKQIKDSIKDKPFRVEGLLKKRKETLSEFVYKFFTKFNETKNTIYLDRTIQTPFGKRRSLGDLYGICLYYYPNCKLKELIDILEKLRTDNEVGFRTSWCKVIKKRTYYYDPKQPSGLFDKDKDDEYGYGLIYQL